MKFTHCMLAAFGVALLLQAPARAQQPPPSTRPDVPVVTRVYDISDLEWLRHNYPLIGVPGSAGAAFGPGMGGLGAAPGPVSPIDPATGLPSGPSRLEMASSLVKLLQDTVDVGSWRENGGFTGSMRELSGQLIVTQTEENQKLISSVLTQLRDQSGPQQMVCVRAYWMMLSPQDIAGVFDAAKKRQAKEGETTMPTVDDAMIAGTKLYCQGQTICFNGQTVHITSGRQWSVVSKLSPVVASSAVGYDPTMSIANSGVSMEVTPQLVPNQNNSILDLRSTVTETRGPSGPIDLVKISTTQPAIDPRVAVSTTIDRLNVVNQEFATTVRLPLGKKVLLGGMTLEPASTTDPGRQLYLVVEVDAMK